MRKLASLWCLLSVCGLCSCTGPTTRELYRDANVTVKNRSLGTFPPHGWESSTTSLTVFGKTYRDVRGTAPFHLAIPSNDLILFVTGHDENGRGKAVVNVANLQTKKVQSFPAYDSHIGRGIRTETGGLPWDRFERVESVNGDRIVIYAGFWDRRYRYYLDLAKPAFEKEEGVEPDPVRLSRTNIYVWPSGKAPRD